MANTATNNQSELVARLQERVTSLEGKYNTALGIIIAVAAIFGTGGTFGGIVLNNANERITKLQESAAAVSATYTAYEEALKKAKDSALGDVRTSAGDAVRQQAQSQLSTFVKRGDLDSVLGKFRIALPGGGGVQTPQLYDDVKVAPPPCPSGWTNASGDGAGRDAQYIRSTAPIGGGKEYGYLYRFCYKFE